MEETCLVLWQERDPYIVTCFKVYTEHDISNVKSPYFFYKGHSFNS